ncbi:hypothetical protein TL16_g07484 [Triparma laevis f. inornata]|uniref:Uncharacterized protein n=1 Tax=Triparma laevis f. inornata TaxID=1714386 RepID=A0A9W7EI40_9STRA|nr:hypothetical protein TL16_g07484 [Triparma laevis f. inornata]
MQKTFSERFRFWQAPRDGPDSTEVVKKSQPTALLGDISEGETTVRAPAILGLKRVHTLSLEGKHDPYQKRPSVMRKSPGYHAGGTTRRTSLQPREKRISNLSRFRTESLGTRYVSSASQSSFKASLKNLDSSISASSTISNPSDETTRSNNANAIDEAALVSGSKDKVVVELSNFYQGFMLFFQLLNYVGALIFAIIPQYPSKQIYLDGNTTHDGTWKVCPEEFIRLNNSTKEDPDDWTCDGNVGTLFNFASIPLFCPDSPFECEYTRDFITQTYLPIAFPIVFTTALLSFVLKPCKNTKGYLLYLYGQYIVCMLGSVFFLTIGYGFTLASNLLGFGVCAFFLACLYFIVRVRKLAEKLPEYQLTDFLIFVVFKGGILIGVTQLMFLAFAPLQCIASQQNFAPWIFDADNNEPFTKEPTDDEKAWKNCRRSIYSTTGLAFIVSLYTLFQISAAVVPYKVLRRHILPAKQLIEMNLSFTQALEIVLLCTCAASALFLIGNYGVEGNFGQFGGTTKNEAGEDDDNDTEKVIALVVSAVGFLSLVVTSLWQGVVIMREWKHVNSLGFKDDILHSRSSKPKKRRTQQVGLKTVEDKTAEQTAEEKQREEEDAEEDLVTSKMWVVLAVACTTVNSSLSVAVALTNYSVVESKDHELMRTISNLILPIILIFYIGNLFVYPRRKDPKFLWWMRFHFFTFCWVGEGAMFIDSLKNKDSETLSVWSVYLKYPLRVVGETLGFHLALKIRSQLHRFSSYDLNTFLINTILYGGLQTAASVVFVTFRVTKCVLEVSNSDTNNDISAEIERCKGAASATSWIGVFLLMWWAHSIIRASVISEFSDRVNITIKHLATLKIGWRRRVQGCLMILCGVCATFLFSLTDKLPTSSEGEKRKMLVETLGYIGVGSAFVSLFSEWSTVKKAVRKERMQKGESQKHQDIYDSQVFTRHLPVVQTFVSECSWIYIIVIYVITSAVAMMYVAYAVFSWRCEDEEKDNGVMACKDDVDEAGMRFVIGIGNVVMPICFLLFVMSILMKPKETNPKYMTFLYFHFFTFAVVVELSTSFGYVVKMVRGQPIRKTSLTLGDSQDTQSFYYLSISFVRLVIEGVVFKQLLKVRERLGKLTKEEVSEYLCQTVLVRSSEIMLPIMFLLFECLSCLSQHPIVPTKVAPDDEEEEKFDWEVCSSSTNAAVLLSVYLVLFNLQTLISKSAPRHIQDVKAFTFESIATLDLRKRHRAQIGLFSLTAFCALYLFGILGIETTKEQYVLPFGYVGLFSCVLAILMDSTALTRFYNKKVRERELREEEGLSKYSGNSERKFSSRALQDQMVLASLV